MKILALDTSALVASAAITENGKVLAEYTLNYKLTHSQTIMPMIDEIVKMTETDLNTIDYIACSSGPGSFTGLRIGAATAKGLAHGLNKPIVAVPTLEALAYNIFGSDKFICPIMDARRKQVYNAVYVSEGKKLDVILEEDTRIIDDVLDYVKDIDCDVIFVGDAVSLYKDKIAELDNAIIAPASCNMQRAACVAALAEVYIEEGKYMNGAEFAPEYLRKSQAERELEEKQKAGEKA